MNTLMEYQMLSSIMDKWQIAGKENNMSKTNKYGKTNKEIKESRKRPVDRYWERFCEEELEDADFYLSPSIVHNLRKEA